MRRAWMPGVEPASSLRQRVGEPAHVEPKKKGDVVEGFRILSEIGRGAASIIYLVQDIKTKQIWALKHVIKEGPKDQRFLDQAEAECRIGKELRHPAIRRIERMVRVGSLLRTNELFLVMELVDGTPLDQAPPKTFEEACHVFEQVAEGLSAMHQAGFVHADMKPNNVIVSDAGVAKVIDLGQSCKIGTVKPRIQGTPDYIAPEQVHRRPITPQTDIYNLGATMYWMLTRSKVPTALAGGDSLVSSLDDNLIAKPTPPIELNPRIHPKLNELIMHCLEVVPEARPVTMRVVADRLNLVHGILLAQSDESGQEAFAAEDEED